MKRKKQYATIHKMDSDSIIIKVNDSPSKIASRGAYTRTAKVDFATGSKVSMYRKSSQSKRGVLGIKYTPSYYVGDVHICATNNPNQFLIKKSHIAGSKLSVGDIVVVETATTKKKTDD